MGKTPRVLETNMSDRVDIIHYWKNVDEAKCSGRFDYLIENGEVDEKSFNEANTIEKLVKMGHPYFIIK